MHRRMMILGGVLTIIASGTLVRADDLVAASTPSVVPRPKWSVGDEWVIETQTRPIQGRSADAAEQSSPKIRWTFKVAGIEKVDGADCYRVEIACERNDSVRGPSAVIWCQSDTMFLRQIECQVPAAGQWRTMKESYRHADGLAPVLSPINAIPLDLPAFLPAGSKATHFVVESSPKATGAKDVTSLRFARSVQQSVKAPSEELMKSLPPFAKSIGAPAMEVILEGPGQKVTQVWKAGAPWPIYSDNGRTHATLIAQKNASSPDEGNDE